MVRWWNVTDVTPSGLRLNRAWHIRQFLFALATPVATLVFLDLVSRWEENLMRDRAKLAGARALKSAEDKVLASSDKQKQLLPLSTRDAVETYLYSHVPAEYKEILTVDNLIMNRIRKFADAKDTSAGANPVVEAIRDAISKAIPPVPRTAHDTADTEVPAVQKTERMSPMRMRREERKEQK